MISFDDVRRTPELTMFFIHCGALTEFLHFMREAGIQETDYEVLPYDEIKTRFPGLSTPTVVLDSRLAEIPAAQSDEPGLILSHMDADDLERKRQEIHESADAKAWRRKINERVRASMKEEFDEIYRLQLSPMPIVDASAYDLNPEHFDPDVDLDPALDEPITGGDPTPEDFANAGFRPSLRNEYFKF